MSDDRSSFSGTWASAQAGCKGGTLSAIRYGEASAKRLGSGLPCDGGEGSILFPGGGSGGSAGGNADGTSCAEEMGAPRVGDPIDASTGNFFLQEDDLNGGEWLSFSRFYNSAAGVAPSSLGFNWRHTYDRSLQFFGSPVSSVIMLRPDGKQETFTKTSAGWSTDLPVDVFSEVKNAQGSVTGYQVFIGGRRHSETYALDGRLLSVTGQDGQGVSLTYTAANPVARLSAVTDSAGRKITFFYDSSTGWLSSVHFPDTGYASFSYSAKEGTLSRVIYADSAVHNYSYGEAGYVGATALPRALTGMTDGTTVRYESITYDDLGRATSSSFIGGVGTTKVSYNTDGSSDITYPLGNTVHMGFSSPAGLGRVSTLSAPCAPDCGQPWRSRTYDSLGFPETAIDFNGTVQRTHYNPYGLQEQIVEAQGTESQRTTTTVWDVSLRRPLKETTQTATGDAIKTSAWVYNTMGQVIARCEADPAVAGSTAYTCSADGSAPVGVRRWTYTYCTSVDTTTCPRVGLLLSQTGPRRDIPEITTYRYYLAGGTSWNAGDLQTITDALGHATTFAAYDGAGRVKRIVDANGIITDFTYDYRGHPVSRSVRANANGSASSTLDSTNVIVFDQRGLIIQTIDADGVRLTYTYDKAHRLTDVTDGIGGNLHLTYDASGNPITSQHVGRDGVVRQSMTRTFDTLGRWTGELDGLSQPTFNAAFSDSYDGNGNRLHALMPMREYRRSYDAMNRIVTALDGVGAVDASSRDRMSVTAYDARGEISGMSDPDSLSTTYQRTAFGEVTAISSPDTGNSDASYNENDQVISRRDAKGQVATFTYDALGRPTTATFASAGDSIAWYYDEPNSLTGCAASAPVGRLTRMVQASVATAYCYDAHGNVTRKTQTQDSAADVVDYTYTRADRLNSVASGNGIVLTDVRDTNGQVSGTQMTAGGQNASLVSAATYLPFGPLMSYTLGSSVVTLGYDTNYRLTDINASAYELHLKRDVAGRIVATGATTGVPVADETYSYDGAGRLASVSTAHGPLESYTYNKTGDRLSKTGAGTSTGAYFYATGTHRLIAVGASARSYDANGSTSSLDYAGTPFNLAYDGLNRVQEVKQGGASTAVYTYNALGQRVAKRVGGVTTRFVYDEDGHLLAELGPTMRLYVWMDDLPVAIVDTAASVSTVSYIYADDLGTPRVVTDASGKMKWVWARLGNPFGEKRPTSDGTFDLNLRFPGQYDDAETGFVYNINRYYDPSTGRYLSGDPVGLSAGMSLYQYVESDPLNAYDPLGLCKRCDVMARVLQGNSRLLGKGGAFNGSPPDLKKYGVTADSAAIIPSQFGLTKLQIKPIIEQISGTLEDGSKFKFNHIRDQIDNRATRLAHNWDVSQFQDKVIRDARAKNGGRDTFVLELPGIPRDLGIARVTLTVPDNVSCPEGTL
jgi:RHS repeat-associated protein